MKLDLMEFSVIAGDRTTLAKCKMKSYFDDTKHELPDFPIGSMVQVRMPGLSAKFDDLWLGPYEISKKSPCYLGEFCSR